MLRHIWSKRDTRSKKFWYGCGSHYFWNVMIALRGVKNWYLDMCPAHNCCCHIDHTSPKFCVPNCRPQERLLSLNFALQTKPIHPTKTCAPNEFTASEKLCCSWRWPFAKFEKKTTSIKMLGSPTCQGGGDEKSLFDERLENVSISSQQFNNCPFTLFQSIYACLSFASFLVLKVVMEISEWKDAGYTAGLLWVEHNATTSQYSRVSQI